MQIDSTLLCKLEKLSSLEIEATKRDAIIQELSEIVAFVENLNELDLANQQATFTTVEGGTPFREDIPALDPLVVQTILHHAPQSSDGCFVVPKIIE